MVQYQVIILSDEDVLESGLSLSCDGHEFKYLLVSGVRAREAVVHGRRVPMPASSGVVVGGSSSWQIIPSQGNGKYGSLNVFMCTADGRIGGTLGICTSLDWDTPLWGHQTPTMPGVWLVPCLVPTGVLEFKVIARNHDNTIDWEPRPFINKHIIIDDEPQIFMAQWGRSYVDKIYETREYKRFPTFYVTVPDDVHHALTNCGYTLVMTGTRDHRNKHWLPKNEPIPLSWSEYHQAYRTQLTVPGYITKIHFSLALINQERIITHVDEYGYNKIGITYRILDLALEETIHCDIFVDICPSKTHLALGSSAKSIHDLINTPKPKAAEDETKPCEDDDDTSTSPSKMSLYRGMIMGLVSTPKHNTANVPLIVASKTPDVIVTGDPHDLSISTVDSIEEVTTVETSKSPSFDASIVSLTSKISMNAISDTTFTAVVEEDLVDSPKRTDMATPYTDPKEDLYENISTPYTEAYVHVVTDETVPVFWATGDQGMEERLDESEKEGADGTETDETHKEETGKKPKRRLSLKRLKSGSIRRKKVVVTGDPDVKQ